MFIKQVKALLSQNSRAHIKAHRWPKLHYWRQQT